jgi:hypothetical protein
MSILNTLTSKGSVLSNLNGAEGAQPNFAQSKLHDEYSVNGSPFVRFSPEPSTLSLKGVNPPNTYKDRSPEGRSF